MIIMVNSLNNIYFIKEAIARISLLFYVLSNSDLVWQQLLTAALANLSTHKNMAIGTTFGKKSMVKMVTDCNAALYRSDPYRLR